MCTHKQYAVIGRAVSGDVVNTYIVSSLPPCLPVSAAPTSRQHPTKTIRMSPADTMSRRTLFLFMILPLALHSTASSNRASGNLAGVLESLLDMIASLPEIVKSYEEAANIYRAVALVTIDNYVDRSLTQCTVFESEGKTLSTTPITIVSGSRAAIAVRQTDPLKGLDMVWYCKVKSSRVMVHVSAQQQTVGRKDNVLDVAILEETDDPKLAVNCLESTSFSGPVQCSKNDLAIQATMTTFHQTLVNISIYPTTIGELAGPMREAVENTPEAQRDLDDMLGFDQMCSSFSLLSNYDDFMWVNETCDESQPWFRNTGTSNHVLPPFLGFIGLWAALAI